MFCAFVLSPQLYLCHLSFLDFCLLSSNAHSILALLVGASSKSQRKKVLWPQQYRRYVELCYDSRHQRPGL
ncbi:hypothetical protein C8R42DRAFT_658136 [Lentinula raphanica]|nr:hypothetical protein C8R42DRAFT_658136 [Lentinula raphanica]